MPGRNKNLITRLLFNRITLAIFGFLILTVISVPLARNVSQRYRVSQEVKELEQEINSLEKKNTDLKKLINYFKSDQFIEEQARLNLNYKKEGEKMVVIKEKEKSTSSEVMSDEIFASRSAEYKIRPVSNPRLWWRYFFR